MLPYINTTNLPFAIVFKHNITHYKSPGKKVGLTSTTLLQIKPPSNLRVDGLQYHLVPFFVVSRGTTYKFEKLRSEPKSDK